MREKLLLCIALSAPAAFAGVVAQVELEGKSPLRFVVDTGAQSSVISPAAAARLGLTPRYRTEVVTATGSMLVPVTRAATASVPGALAVDVELLVYGQPGLEADGVLGQNFLSRFNYLLDNRRGRILFSPAAPTGAVLPFEVLEGRPVLEVYGMDSIPLRLVLDTGSSHFVLFRDAARANGHAALTTSAGQLDVRTATFSRLDIGSTRLANVTVALAPQSTRRGEDGLLPAGLFRSIYVNNQEHYLVLNPPSLRRHH